MSATPDLSETILAAWRTNHRVTVFLVSHIPTQIWASPILRGPRGPSSGADRIGRAADRLSLAGRGERRPVAVDETGRGVAAFCSWKQIEKWVSLIPPEPDAARTTEGVCGEFDPCPLKPSRSFGPT
jgi:hypothetical protein